jgi:predicted alpha/beta hydrolase family esterase
MALQRVVIGALDDPIVPYTYTDSLAKSLDAKMVTVAKGGHFMGSDGFTEFPLLLDELSHFKP